MTWGTLALALATSLGAPLAASESPAELLSRYLQIDTSNPPGGEAAAAEFLAELLHREGVATRLLVSPGGRTNLYARLDGGQRAEGSIVLMHHMDVVPPAEGWTVEPFSGMRLDGFLWGPGAVDDKSLGIAQLLGFLEVAREGGDLAHDLILLAVADEETGGAEGTAWILDRHPELFADTVGVLTEGGSNRVFKEKTFWWGIEVAQKRPLWLEIETRGRPGHGSKIDLHSAPNQILRALNGVLDLPREYRLVPEVRTYFESVAALAPQDDDWLAGVEAAIASDRIEGYLRPGQHNLFLDTIQVTVLDAGQQVNAIPDRARARIDVRALPDTDLDALLHRIRTALGDKAEVRVLLDAPPVEPSPTDSVLFRCLQSALADQAPSIPMMIAGVTDARHFRRLGIPAYGFSPFAAGLGDAQGVHGSDERLSEKIFERGVLTMTRVVRDCAGAR